MSIRVCRGTLNQLSPDGPAPIASGMESYSRRFGWAPPQHCVTPSALGYIGILETRATQRRAKAENMGCGDSNNPGPIRYDIR